jgi:hypothetical protein
LYLESDGTTLLSAPRNTLVRVRDDQGNTLGTFFDVDGADFDDAGAWIGGLAADLAANFGATDVVGNQLILNFAKFTFASLQSWTNAAARELFFDIIVQKFGRFSLNAGNTLTLSLNCTQETFNNPSQLCFSGDWFFVTNFANEAAGNNSRVGRVSECWTGNNFIDDITDRGIRDCDIDGSDTNSATGVSMYFGGAVGATTREIWATEVTSLDADGLPNFGTAVNLQLGVTATAAPMVALSQTTRIVSRPALVGANPLVASANIGTYAAPDYSSFLNFQTLFGSMNNTQAVVADSSDRFYTIQLILGSYIISVLTYSGGATHAAWTNGANWSIAELRANLVGAQGLAVDEANIVNGFPTIYVMNAGSHIIQTLTNNGGVTGTETDWDIATVAGSGVQGNADGLGVLATLDEPFGGHINGGILYFTQKSSHNVRTFNISTTSVDQWRGEYNTLGALNATEF